MPKQPCLVVPLVNVEVARRMLIELNALDRTFTPERVGDELALPIREEVVLANGAFQHRIEKIEVRLAPLNRSAQPIEGNTDSNDWFEQRSDSNHSKKMGTA